MKRNINNNQGQVLLIVIVAMAVTLGVGLGLTSRTTESLKRTGNLDSLQKVTAAAEGGLEKFLIKPDSALDELSNNTGFEERQVFANGTYALIKVSKLTAGSSGMIYEKIKPSESVVFLTTEFSASDATMNTSYTAVNATNTCVRLEVTPANVSYMLNVVTSNPALAVTFDPLEDPLDPTTSGSRLKTNSYLMESYLYDNVNGSYSFKVRPPTQDNCNAGYFKFSNSYMLRFQPLSAEVEKLVIKVQEDSVKKITQGFKLISRGAFSEDFSADKTSRTIEAYKYLDTSSPIFDYALYLDN